MRSVYNVLKMGAILFGVVLFMGLAITCVALGAIEQESLRDYRRRGPG